MIIKNKQELLNEVDMLKGNINRICVCDDLTELSAMLATANWRLSRIALYNIDKLNEQKERD